MSKVIFGRGLKMLRLLTDPISTAGAGRFLSLDLHAGQILGFFRIPVDELTAFHMLSDCFRAKAIPDTVVIVADIGATKRLRNFAEALRAPLAII